MEPKKQQQHNKHRFRSGILLKKCNGTTKQQARKYTTWRDHNCFWRCHVNLTIFWCRLASHEPPRNWLDQLHVSTYCRCFRSKTKQHQLIKTQGLYRWLATSDVQLEFIVYQNFMSQASPTTRKLCALHSTPNTWRLAPWVKPNAFMPPVPPHFAYQKTLNFETQS